MWLVGQNKRTWWLVEGELPIGSISFDPKNKRTCATLSSDSSLFFCQFFTSGVLGVLRTIKSGVYVFKEDFAKQYLHL